MSQKDENNGAWLASFAPQFYEAVRDFPDFALDLPASAEDIAALQTRHEFAISAELKEFFSHISRLAMNGLSIGIAELGTIDMPNSQALIIGYFYLHNPGDRLLMLPDDPSIYYLEQRNGGITRLAASLRDFFNVALPRHLYG